MATVGVASDDMGEAAEGVEQRGFGNHLWRGVAAARGWRCRWVRVATREGEHALRHNSRWTMGGGFRV
uniref:Uncharacterized protein n=1 Tax=Oryza rufipogon TaxID=4529 RepID=A0A0E0Q8D4_ORYRU